MRGLPTPGDDVVSSSFAVRQTVDTEAPIFAPTQHMPVHASAWQYTPVHALRCNGMPDSDTRLVRGVCRPGFTSAGPMLAAMHSRSRHAP